MRPHLGTLVDTFRQNGQQIAIVRYRGNRRHATTYSELADSAERFASLLESRGITEGERVMLWGENGAEWIAAFFGCVLRGVLVVPIDAAGSVDFALRVANDVRAALVIADRDFLRHFGAEYSTLSLEDLPESLPKSQAKAIASLSLDTPLQILFTSGTTGEPKGVVHSHRNVLASLDYIEREIEKYRKYERFVHPVRFLHTLPLSHVFGQFMGLWVPPLLATEVHFQSRLVASQLIETIKHERISVVAAVPRVLSLMRTQLEAEYPGLEAALVDAQSARAWTRWWKFRKIHRRFGFKFWAFVCGGAALPADVERFWNTLGFILVQGYGMTETAALITLNHPFKVAKGSIGKPLPGREVKIGPDGEVLVRGDMISRATWQQGRMQEREEPWLATGDIAQVQPTGELRFLGRKSEVIVTAAGLNIHPEDLEAALDRQAGVVASAVVGVDSPAGREPFAVLAYRGTRDEAAVAVAAANEQLADFQRIRRWAVWPEPDLPRTSTGKVRRRAVGDWLASNTSDVNAEVDNSGDWLIDTIARITGEQPSRTDDGARLEDDLHLDSLGRVELAAALERQMGTVGSEDDFVQLETLGQLRLWAGLTAGVDTEHSQEQSPADSGVRARTDAPPRHGELVYPFWPLSKLVTFVRVLFLEIVLMPLAWLLAAPRVKRPHSIDVDRPVLLIANHVTAYDLPLIMYALPRKLRDKLAAAMSGEMLDDWRHARRQANWFFNLIAPLEYLVVTAVFNVFPLPKSAGFQRSFQHAGEVMDRGFHVIVFPEGFRTLSGKMNRFRPGIGILAKQANAPILPVALRGITQMKVEGKGWFRSGRIEVAVGDPITIDTSKSPEEITELLETKMRELLGE